MKLMSKLNMVILIFSFSFANIANADQYDPCSNIVGHWDGAFINRYGLLNCNYDIDAVGEIRGDSVTLRINKFNPNHKHFCPRNLSLTITGTCYNGELRFFGDFVGRIDNHSIFLNDSSGEYSLYKM